MLFFPFPKPKAACYFFSFSFLILKCRKQAMPSVPSISSQIGCVNQHVNRGSDTEEDDPRQPGFPLGESGRTLAPVLVRA